jgi:hypothetical protein
LLAALSMRPVKARIFAQIGGAGITLPAAALRSRATENQSFMMLLLRHITAMTFQAEQGVACNVLHGVSSRLAQRLSSPHPGLHGDHDRRAANNDQRGSFANA